MKWWLVISTQTRDDAFLQLTSNSWDIKDKACSIRFEAMGALQPKWITLS